MATHKKSSSLLRALLVLLALLVAACAGQMGGAGEDLPDGRPGAEPPLGNDAATGGDAPPTSQEEDAAPPLPPDPTWTNEKPGSRVLLDCGFENLDCDGALWEVYPGAGDIETPDGESSTTSTLLPNAVTGGQQTIWPRDAAAAEPLREIYVGLLWKMNSDFEGNIVGNKLFFVGAQDWPLTGTPVNGVFGVTGNPRYGPAQLTFGHNTSWLNNDHTCSLDLGLTCFPNRGAGIMERNRWYKIEAYVKASSCNTCRDGIVRWWLDGQLVGEYTDINYGQGIINEFQINHTWDGSRGYQPYDATANPLGRDMSKTWKHWIAHLHISTP